MNNDKTPVVDRAREELSEARRNVIRWENGLTAALADRDRAEAHLYRVSEFADYLHKHGEAS